MKNVQLCSTLHLVHSLTQNWRVKSVISLPAQCKVLLLKLTTTLSLKEFPTFSNPKFHRLAHDIHAYCQQAANSMNPISLEDPFQYYSPVYDKGFPLPEVFARKVSPFPPPHSTLKYLIFYAVSMYHGHILRSTRTH